MPGGHEICKRRVSHRRSLPCGSVCLEGGFREGC
uniref:Uncharacterized protein n=1 Tax=Arundo donax TaxID=35708 RepID=A0A0A9G0T0_ARUDO